MVTRLVVLLQMLFDEGGFAHPLGTYDCNELRIPMDLIHLVPDYVCLNLKKVDTFGNNTKSKNETKDTDTTSVQ